ncbi:MAG: fumarylacetoacetate hydrolase family protein [Proteobacteria bacterium]|nr:fumarylacetoacetate hydrolase family protein [Pseudomonadota bacterium]MBS0461427.1 fumarylacetoacetate hydrolase family protein [Pseudomonadota bacterium]
MATLLVPQVTQPVVAIKGRNETFSVHRIYCVGRNFAEHAKEMGAQPSKPNDPPVFFMKPADAVVADGTTLPYPRGTSELHHEVELVVALGAGADGIVAADNALDLVFGYSVGLDLTRRDLQARAKARGLPWDVAKGFDHSAPLAPIVPVSECGHPRDAILSLHVNDRLVQRAPLSEMIFSVAAVLHELSRLYDLRAGDLIFMGTPAGVGPLHPGDRFIASVEGLATLTGAIAG